MHEKQDKESSGTNQDLPAPVLLALHFKGMDDSSESQVLAQKMSEWKSAPWKM